MPGHNGLFARQFPIAFSYYEYLATLGFYRRRFDLFAINQFAFAIASGFLLFLSRLANGQAGVVICFIAKHGPRYAYGFVRQGNGSDIRVSSLCDVGGPAT
jgi:hypothetical protein